jgi:hypothetical protein
MMRKDQNKKNKKTNKHCNFCGRDGPLESKCFKTIQILEETMKKCNINIYYFSSNSYSHGHVLSTFAFSFNETVD